MERTILPLYKSGLARTGLRVGNGHRFPSPGTELLESAWRAETCTASCLAKGERKHLYPGVPGNSGRTKVGIGTTLAMQRSTSTLRNKSQIRATVWRFNIHSPDLSFYLDKLVSEVQDSWDVNCSQGEELVLSPKEETACMPVKGAWPWTPLAIYMGYYQHVVCHDNHMAPPEWGEKVNQSQDDSSQLQAVYVPGEELSFPNSTRWSALEDRTPACQGCVRHDHLAMVNRAHSNSTLEKMGIPPY